METIYLVSVNTDIKTEETGTLTINRETPDTLKLTLTATIDSDINKQNYFIKIFYADRPQIKRKLQLKKQNGKFRFSFSNTQTLILTEKGLHAAKIQEVALGYKENTWVPIIKSFDSLPKRVFITNMVSFNNSNTHFQLTGAKETQWYLPSLTVTLLLNLSLKLTVVLDDIHYHFALTKKDNTYTIETPNFIPYAKGGPLIVYACITDNDTHAVIWFSQNTRFPLSKGLSYIQVELRGYVKQDTYYPVLLIPRSMENSLEVFNNDKPVTKIVVSVYKNSIYSLNYVSSTSESNLPPKFLGDAGPRKIELSFKDGDSFTIINATILLEKTMYYFVNKTLQTGLFTLKHSEKRFKKPEGPKSDIK
jgi:hypothetical protein